jgi:cytochrome b561
MKTKIIFYLLIGILFYFISDILRTQEDFSKKIVGIILFCIFISYISNYFLGKYYKGPFYYKILITLGIIIGVLIISLILVHFIINKPNYDYADINDVFDASFKKNLYYFIFYFVLLIFYTIILYMVTRKGKFTVYTIRTIIMSSKKIFDAMEAGNWKKVEEIVTAKPSF